MRLYRRTVGFNFTKTSTILLLIAVIFLGIIIYLSTIEDTIWGYLVFIFILYIAIIYAIYGIWGRDMPHD